MTEKMMAEIKDFPTTVINATNFWIAAEYPEEGFYNVPSEHAIGIMKTDQPLIAIVAKGQTSLVALFPKALFKSISVSEPAKTTMTESTLIKILEIAKQK